MNRKKITLTLLAACLFIFAGQAQKLKEKKDIVYLDDVPQYKIEKSGGNLLKGISYLATSLNGDTLIRFNFKSISIPNLPHEDIGKFWSYFIVDLVPVHKSVELDYSGKKELMEIIQQNGLIVDGKLTEAGVSKLFAASEKFQTAKAQIDSAVLHRKNLAENKSYKEYSKLLFRRGMNDDQITFNGADIMMGMTKIGSWKIASDNNYGTLYHLIRADGKMTASVFFEKGKKRIYTTNLYDKKGHEEFIQTDFTYGHLTEQIKWLTLWGYL